MTIWYSPRDEITVKEILQNQYSWWLASDPLQLRRFPGWGSAWTNPLFKSFDHMLESNFEEFSCTFTKVNSVIQLKMHMKNHLYYKSSRKKLVLLLLKLPSPLCYLILTFVYTVKQSGVRTATIYVQICCSWAGKVQDSTQFLL